MTKQPGQLQVRVYTSRAKLPVVGATVVVTQGTSQGTFRLLTVQMTDSSGYTKPIPVPAPPLENSTEPDTQGMPFATCDVWAESPGFAMLLAEGVQVFPDTVTVQPMSLEPLLEGEQSLSATEVNEIPPQNL